MKEVDFKEKKALGKIFSFIEEFRGDFLTPIGIFSAIGAKRKFMFESGTKGTNFGRYSFIGGSYEDITEFHSLEALNEEGKREFDESSNLLPFKGGVIGYTAYNLIGKYEKTLKYENEDKLNIPDCLFTRIKDYICYDHFTHKVIIIKTIFEDDKRSYQEIKSEVNKQYQEISNFKFEVIQSEEVSEKINFKSNFTKEQYLERVERCKEYIKAGDIFQVVFSQQITSRTNKTGIEIYRKLREENPSPYMFYIDNGSFEIVGASPESLVSVRDKKVITNPIAGTRKRGKTIYEDRELELDLLGDEKEKAEHVMLVDLGRNDIGKISKIGTVKVEEFMNIERFSHVMHMTSKVSGQLKEGIDSIQALISCMPAGTVSGAPKIRAMEIIEELENRRRGAYAGAVGYFSYGGNMDLSIAIRTMVIKDKTAFIQAGGGIVYDSDPEKEYEESLNKARILMEVLK